MQHLVNGSTQNPQQVVFSFLWQFRLISHNTTCDWATCNTKCWCQSMHADTRHLGNAVWKGLGVSGRVHTAWNLLQWTWHKKAFLDVHQHIPNSESKTDICPIIKRLTSSSFFLDGLHIQTPGSSEGSGDQAVSSSRNSKSFWDPPIPYPMISLTSILNLRQ